MGKDLKGKELGEYLSQRVNGSYMARFTDRFGRRKCFYSYDLKEVKAVLNAAVYEDKNKLNVVEDSITLNEWFEKWITVYKYKTIRKNTKRQYIHIYRAQIAPALGAKKLCDITQFMIRNLINDLDKQGYKYSTKYKVKILLVDMFDRAIADDFVRKNPARGIQVVRDECDEDNVRVLTIEEQQTFFNCCKGTFYDNLFVTAVNTGLRPGELCALRWEDIDFRTNEVIVTKTLLYQKLEDDEQKTFHLELPKTKTSKRRVPLNKTAIIALKKQKLQSDSVKSKSPKYASVPDEFKDLLFITKHGTPINAVVYNDAIIRIIDEINSQRDLLEEFDKFSAHCFRHTFATRCFESGIQPKTVQSYLGHASLKMTMDLYTHVLDNHKKEEMNKFEELMGTLNDISEDELEEIVDKELKSKKVKNNVIKLSKAL